MAWKYLLVSHVTDDMKTSKTKPSAELGSTHKSTRCRCWVLLCVASTSRSCVKSFSKSANDGSPRKGLKDTSP